MKPPGFSLAPQMFGFGGRPHDPGPARMQQANKEGRREPSYRRSRRAFLEADARLQQQCAANGPHEGNGKKAE